MDSLYREHILDHYKHPRNFGSLSAPTHHASENLVSCGDQLTVSLIISENVISDIRFSGTGCAISIASASLLSEFTKDKKVAEVRSFSKETILKLLGIDLGPTRLKCALLSLEVLHKALPR